MWSKEQYIENQGKVYETLQNIIEFEREYRRNLKYGNKK